MRRLTPLVFALVALHLSLSYTADVGWNHHQEHLGDRYDCLSHSILKGDYLDCHTGAAPTAYRLPVYPVVLAGMFGAFGGSEAAARLLQSVIAACTVYVAVAFAQRLGGVGWIAGVGCVVSWSLYYFASMLMTESLFALLLLLFVVALTDRHWRTSGVLLGLLLLTRGTLLFSLPFLALLVPRRAALRFALPALCIVGLWAARNAVVMRAFVPFSTGNGSVLWGANNPLKFAEARGDWINPPHLPDWDSIKDLPEVELDHAQTRLALDYVRTVTLPVLAIEGVAKAWALWGGFEEGYSTWTIKLCAVVAAVYCLLSLRWQLARRRRLLFGGVRRALGSR